MVCRGFEDATTTCNGISFKQEVDECFCVSEVLRVVRFHVAANFSLLFVRTATSRLMWIGKSHQVEVTHVLKILLVPDTVGLVAT